MRIGAEQLIETFGSPLGVAEALLENRINKWDQEFVKDIVDHIILEAAKIRIEWKKLDKKI